MARGYDSPHLKDIFTEARPKTLPTLSAILNVCEDGII